MEGLEEFHGSPHKRRCLTSLLDEHGKLVTCTIPQLHIIVGHGKKNLSYPCSIVRGVCMLTGRDFLLGMGMGPGTVREGVGEQRRSRCCSHPVLGGMHYEDFLRWTSSMTVSDESLH